MEDSQIIDLYFARQEQAIHETADKYGGYCYSIAYNILVSKEDAEESVNDTYLRAWDSIPPTRPSQLGAFLGRITRNLSIDLWRRRSAGKRAGGEMALALEELSDIAGQDGNPEAAAIREEVARCIQRFLCDLPQTERRIFLCRYWYLDSVKEIAQKAGFTESKVTSLLHRMRNRLKRQLEKEGLL